MLKNGFLLGFIIVSPILAIAQEEMTIEQSKLTKQQVFEKRIVLKKEYQSTMKKLQVARQKLAAMKRNLPKAVLEIYRFHKYLEWNNFLQKIVVSDSMRSYSFIDYKKVDAKELNKIIDKWLKVPYVRFEKWGPTFKAAFYLNLINALTIKKIGEAFPGLTTKAHSPKNLKLDKTFWNTPFFTLFNNKLSLSDLRNKLTEVEELNFDPSVFLLTFPGTLSSPITLTEAFSSVNFPYQIEAVSKSFFKDKAKNRYNKKTGKLELSQIFKWYKNNPTHNHLQELKKFIAKYSKILSDNKNIQQQIEREKIEVAFLPFNYQINDYSHNKTKRPVPRKITDTVSIINDPSDKTPQFWQQTIEKQTIPGGPRSEAK